MQSEKKKISPFHDDLLSRNQRDTNTKQNRNENHRNWPGVNMKVFGLPFLNIDYTSI